MISTAFLYHYIILDVQPASFSWSTYLVFAATVGIIYGGFAAAACSRFLDFGQQTGATLPSSLVSWTGAFATVLFLTFLGGYIGDLSRVSLTSGYLIGIPVLIGMRNLIRSVSTSRMRSGELTFQRVAVVGRRIDVVGFLLNGHLSHYGYRLTNVLYLDDTLDGHGIPREEPLADFAADAMRLGASYVIFVGDNFSVSGMQPLFAALRRFALNFAYAPVTPQTPLNFVDVVAIGPNNALRFMRKPLSDAGVFAKRTMDLVLSGLGLLVLAPFFLIIAAIIRLDSDGPVFYRQARRGFNGDIFMIWKFRTMSVMESGWDIRQATRGDARVTRVGRYLRAFSIDELPQLFNVFVGEMSLVGPRPHAVSHDNELSSRLATYAHRQRIKPGITGWAQVNGFRGETSTQEMIEGRTAHDLYYIDNWSLFLDVWIVILTIFSPTARRNAH
ncbi:MAG: exopolysaccharide biosynthesis polyprenyl glycosylphosphotransferase [Bauldia sp.]|uniref:exopolysaccharide biosynthesis polyprenyl glycosylphosphotransferase n=1 Tax=Bauldia sp. TaxID=2575872 RepID=UPI001D459512|nr:exopolysaccharide biosynthesis polyprenyl glycosylphosphotransferase [Bauldia sp.]MCB1494702.1 exopolysaccharide biosynthesis polyprenyl glycosylphosphotransferase [Bauldia sp.]